MASLYSPLFQVLMLFPIFCRLFFCVLHIVGNKNDGDNNLRQLTRTRRSLVLHRCLNCCCQEELFVCVNKWWLWLFVVILAAPPKTSLLSPWPSRPIQACHHYPNLPPQGLGQPQSFQQPQQANWFFRLTYQPMQTPATCILSPLHLDRTLKFH